MKDSIQSVQRDLKIAEHNAEVAALEAEQYRATLARVERAAESWSKRTQELRDQLAEMQADEARSAT